MTWLRRTICFKISRTCSCAKEKGTVAYRLYLLATWPCSVLFGRNPCVRRIDYLMRRNAVYLVCCILFRNDFLSQEKLQNIKQCLIQPDSVRISDAVDVDDGCYPVNFIHVNRKGSDFLDL